MLRMIKVTDKAEKKGIFNEIVELKKRRMEILFAPVSKRPVGYVKNLREIKRSICKLVSVL
jgi:hypothetical protein